MTSRPKFPVWYKHSSRVVRLMSRSAYDTPVRVRMPAEMAAELRRLARERRTTVSAVIRSALGEQEKTQLLAAKIEQVLQMLEKGGVRGPTAATSQEDGPGTREAGGVREPELPAGDGARSEEDLIRDMHSILGAFGGDDE